MTIIELKRGETVRRSVAGERGFFYPDLDGRAIMLQSDCTALAQTGWQSSTGFTPYTVPSTAIAEKDRYDTSATYMVVWVRQDG